MWPVRVAPSPPPAPHASSNALPSVPPRHPSQLSHSANGQIRPQFSPRSSSLNISPKLNASNLSVSSSRQLTGSGLKQEIVSKPDSRDSLDVLQDIAGKPLTEDTAIENNSWPKEGRKDPRDGAIDFGRQGLREFVHRSKRHADNETLGEDPLDQVNGECEYVRPESISTNLHLT